MNRKTIFRSRVSLRERTSFRGAKGDEGVRPIAPARRLRQRGGAATFRSRGAYSLVELMVVISINAVLMAVGAGLLGTLLRTEYQGRRHFERTSGLVRLADQWRGDVAASVTAMVVPGAAGVAADPRAGNEAQPAPATTALRLQGAQDNKIEFFRDGMRLRRIEYQGPTVVRREAYPLSDLTDAHFSVSEAHIATIRLQFGDDPSGDGNVWQIDAHLGRDGRFTDREQPREER